MSALAQIMADLGFCVQGSDVSTRYFTQEALEERNIPIYPFSAANLREGLTVIVSNAFGDEHEEVVQARKMGLRVFRYHQFLAYLSQKYVNIAITGTHGKTSTTGLMAHVLGAFKPTSYLIGDGTGKGIKNSQYFVFEACEYRRHFLAYRPDYQVITNIDYDHPDYYRDVEDVLEAFQTLVNQTKRGIVACGDDPNVRRLRTSLNLLTYGVGQDNQLRAANIEVTRQGMAFDAIYRGQYLDRFLVPLFGQHNVLNALAVIGFCLVEQIPLHLVKEQLATFPGVKRRFTEKKWFNNNVLIDDYAHHPTEIKATIEAVRAKYPSRRLVSIFQPHTFTRTEKFLDEFAEALALSDDVFLCDIFASAREKAGNLTIQDLLAKLPAAQLISVETIDRLHRFTDAVLLFMGAGDIQKLQLALEQSKG